MQHSITVENYGVRLRPACLDDAPFIVWLRNMEHAKGYIGDSAQDIASQEKWLRRHFDLQDDYYFIIETTCGIPVGTYGIYKIKGDRGESGRWIVRPEVPAAIPSIVLGFGVGFERLGLRTLKSHTVSTNHRVLSLNRKLGLKAKGVAPVGQIINGQAVQLIEFELQAHDWSAVRETILPLARLAGENIRKWEQSGGSSAL
ncbi:MAG: GNAT family protein [Verrucomicrobia bacterium]|nr:GNAT family protein [Verrucomicrobiota bacterium]